MNKLKTLCLVAVVAVSSTAHSLELTYENVKRLSANAINQKQVRYFTPVLKIECDAYTFNRGRVYLPISDPIDYVILTQMELDVLRLGFGKQLNRPFWEPLVKRAEAVVRDKMVRIAQSVKLNNDEKLTQLASLNSQIWDEIGKTLADAIDLPQNMSEMDGGWNDVSIKTIPRSAQVYVIHYLVWSRLEAEGLSRKQIMDTMDLVPEGASIKWSGKHIVFVRFQKTNKTVGPQSVPLRDSGTLTIDENGVMEFLAIPKMET